MISETEWVFERAKLYQTMRDHPDWSLRQCGRELGHDLKWVRKWQQRFQEANHLSLEVFSNRSRTPKTIRTRIGDEAKALVSDLRRELSEAI